MMSRPETENEVLDEKSRLLIDKFLKQIEGHSNYLKIQSGQSFELIVNLDDPDTGYKTTTFTLQSGKEKEITRFIFSVWNVQSDKKQCHRVLQRLQNIYLLPLLWNLDQHDPNKNNCSGSSDSHCNRRSNRNDNRNGNTISQRTGRNRR